MYKKSLLITVCILVSTLFAHSQNYTQTAQVLSSGGETSSYSNLYTNTSILGETCVNFILNGSIGYEGSMGFLYSSCPWVIVEDIFQPQEAKVYPNPTSGEICLKLNDDTTYKATVYDLMGTQHKVIHYNKKIDVSTLSDGMYLLLIEYPDRSYERLKFIKK